MSYARFGWDGSNVYVFASSSGIECCGCILSESSFRTTDPALMLSHLLEHRQTGDVVPMTVEAEIAVDWAHGEFAAWDTSDPKGPRPDRDGPRCAHCHQPAADHLAFGKCAVEVDGSRHTFTEES